MLLQILSATQECAFFVFQGDRAAEQHLPVISSPFFKSKTILFLS